jgi:hypothetical protein
VARFPHDLLLDAAFGEVLGRAEGEDGDGDDLAAIIVVIAQFDVSALRVGVVLACASLNAICGRRDKGSPRACRGWQGIV